MLNRLFNNPDKTCKIKKIYKLICCLGTYFLKEIIDESHSRTIVSIFSLSILPDSLIFFSRISSKGRLQNLNKENLQQMSLAE